MTDERYARIVRLIGPAGLARLRAACVTVVGLGAVGSYAVEALARAGVGHLRLVDFDVVHPSNVNRQLYALSSTLSLPKVQVACARVADINPDCRTEGLQLFVHKETIDQVLAGPPGLVLDCIDAMTPKVELLAACLGRRLAVLSSMGAALRTDPTAVRVGPLAQVQNCPLARQVRKQLRQRGLDPELTCVYSIEPVHDLPDEAVGEPDPTPGQLHRGRQRRTLGSLPTLTGIFGLTAANAALKILLQTTTKTIHHRGTENTET